MPEYAIRSPSFDAAVVVTTTSVQSSTLTSSFPVVPLS